MKLIDWIVGREPVATATGIAAVVTALLGVAAAFGLDITAEQIAAIGAFAAAVAGWAGRSAVTPVVSAGDRRIERAMGRLDTSTVGGDSRIDDAEREAERGGLPLALILVGLAVIVGLGLFFGACDALFEDEDEVNDLGAPALVLDHERDRCWDGECYGQNYEDQWSNEDRNRNRNRNRGAFSPGPFDDSPVDAFNGNVVCLPGSTCHADRRGEEPPPEQGEPA